MNIIEIKDLNRYFGEGENRVHILKNVSLNIEKGDFVFSGFSPDKLRQLV